MRQFVIEQKITMLANQYRIYRADDAGTKQEQIGFAHQKRFAFREKFEVYADEQKSTVLFKVEARSVIDLGARYDVYGNDSRLIGTLGKAFKTSLKRSTWQIFAPNQEDSPVAIAQERNKVVAVLRRIWGLIPDIGEIPFPVRYHFDFLDADGQTIHGSLNKTTRFKDHYLLSADDTLSDQVDWRVLVALGIMLDALQSR